MNKAQLVDAIAEKAGLTKADAKRSLDAFTEIVVKTLKKNDKIALVGFGTFSISQRSARTGRNPRTGDPIKIKAKKVAKFKAGSDLSF
ncbi:MAG: HU family DNA-binding protein [Prevotellaceae bacterium]|jgi:DNA-binding protein HU-beta|nr:HU family DNA-binding protein [Prevotellaceae bacterium]